jgi:DNA invertase Pin-like site-specific DNA recombinase
VPKLDRLARSVPDARHIADSLVARGIKLSLGGAIYDPADPLGKMFFNILATFAEFEVDLLRLRTREGMAVARAKGKLRGKQPKLTARQQAELTRMHATGEYTIADLMEVFSVGRATVLPRSRAHPSFGINRRTPGHTCDGLALASIHRSIRGVSGRVNVKGALSLACFPAPGLW